MTGSAVPHDARTLALAVLLQCLRKDAFVQEALDQHLQQTPLPDPDRRLATQLVYGVLRRRGTLDWLLRPLVHREPHKVEPWLWEALRLGAYQLRVKFSPARVNRTGLNATLRHLGRPSKPPPRRR